MQTTVDPLEPGEKFTATPPGELEALLSGLQGEIENRLKPERTGFRWVGGGFEWSPT